MSDPDSVGVHPSDQIFNWVMTILRQPIATVAEILTDPLKSSMELIVIVFLLLLMWILYWHRDRIVYLLTGDPNLHCDPIDVGATTLRFLCGDGEWTRCLTSLPCCYGCCYRQNLMAAVGQGLGVSSVPIKLSHIVVGDLPDSGVNSYYLCIECKTDPQMVSSVAEHKLPKIIHFPEIFIIRLRKNIFEWHLRISVRRLTAVGHEELCEAFFTWSNLLEWCDEEEQNRGAERDPTSPGGGAGQTDPKARPVTREKRFQMRPLTTGLTEAIPWVSLRFSYPRGSDKRADAVQTDANSGNNNSTYWFQEPPLIWGDPENVESTDVAKFKSRHALLDSDGRRIYEPKESNINFNYRVKNWPHVCVRISMRLLLFAILLMSVFRYYSLSCYSSYEAYTKLVHNNNTWRRVGLPISSREIVDVESYCKVRVDAGYDSHEGQACNPSFQQVNEVCKNPPGDQRPTAFTKALNRYFDLDVQSGIECPDWVCPFHNSMAVKYDGPLVLGFIVMAIMLSCFSTLWNFVMRKRFNRMLREGAELRPEQDEENGSCRTCQQDQPCCVVM